MSRKNLFIVSVVFCIAISQTSGQECRPEPVQNIILHENYTLTWAPHINETCSIDYYLVQIHNGLTVDYTQRTTTPSLSLDFLPLCESFRFLISPVSTDSIAGIERVFFSRLPLPADANLTVGLVMVSEEGNAVQLQWVMQDEFEQCADRFRIIIYDEDDNTAVDEYTRELSFNIIGLVPCTRYIFGVVALYNVELEGPIVTVERKLGGAPISPPTLESIQLGSTSVDLTWRLAEYNKNRCAVRSLEVNTPSFNVTQEIQDLPARFPVRVSIPNLQAGNIYVLNVTVINEAGRSIPTILAVQTLD